MQDLEFQLICVDATLSRGTLALLEKYMIENNIEREEIDIRIDKLSKDYIYYLYSKKIYDKLLIYCKKNRIIGLNILNKLKQLASNGYFEDRD